VQLCRPGPGSPGLLPLAHLVECMPSAVVVAVSAYAGQLECKSAASSAQLQWLMPLQKPRELAQSGYLISK